MYISRYTHEIVTYTKTNFLIDTYDAFLQKTNAEQPLHHEIPEWAWANKNGELR